MKKCFVFILLLIGLKGFTQGFPGTDSMRTYNSKYITNNPATAFTNLRLHTLLRGIIDWIDTARAGTGGGGAVGVDSIAALNDSTIRYRKNGTFKTFVLRGKHWTLQHILNNGSTLVENETITLADSLFFASGKIVVENLRITNTSSQTDTSLYKPTVLDANGNLFKFDRWPGAVTLTNAAGSGDTLLTASNTIKRLDHDATLTFSINANKILIGADTISYVATKHDLTTIDAGTASQGIRKNVSNFELGDVAGQNTVPLTNSRFIRSGNNSIYFQGNKTNEGNANIIFDDTLTATAGDPRFKTWMQINSLDHIPAPYLLGTSSVDDGTTGFNNHVMNFGFNLQPNGGRSNLTYGAFGISWEGNFQGLQEMHYFWIPKDNVQRRISSFTLDTAAKTVDWYGQISSWSLKNVSSGAEPWVQFAGGNGGTTSNFHLYTGSTNQYDLQYGFSSSGGNTTASISTTGPGNKSFGLDSWSDVLLPKFSSFQTHNEFEVQAIPSVDGTLALGNPTNRWSTISGMVGRSANGILIGDYSGDELPNTALEIERPGNANGQIHVIGTDAVGNGIEIEGPAGGNTFGIFRSKTATQIPFITLFDQDDGSMFGGFALERGSSPIMGGLQNDMLVYAGGVGKDFRIGTNSGSGRTTRMMITSTGTVNIADLAGSGTRMVTADASGNLSTQAIPSGSQTLQQVLTTGSTLTTNNTIANGTNQLDITGSRNFADGYTFGVTNTTGTVGVAIRGIATTGRGVWAEATSGQGIYGNATSGYGVFSSATTGNALYAQSTSGVAVEQVINPSSTNTVVPVEQLSRTTSGTAANGIGQSVQFYTETDSGVPDSSAFVEVSLTDAAAATATSKLVFKLSNNALLSEKMTIAGNGQITEHGYGAATFTGTPATRPVYTSAGVKVEEIHPKIYTALISQSGTSDPTVTVLGTNTIGTIVWTRSIAGTYVGTLTGAFTADKTFIVCTNTDESLNIVYAKCARTNANAVTLRSYDGTFALDDEFTNMAVEIRVYP